MAVAIVAFARQPVHLGSSILYCVQEKVEETIGPWRKQVYHLYPRDVYLQSCTYWEKKKKKQKKTMKVISFLFFFFSYLAAFGRWTTRDEEEEEEEEAVGGALVIFFWWRPKAKSL